MKKIILTLLLIVQPVFSADFNLEVKPPFAELSERMEMTLTDDFVDQLRPFARNLGRRLDGILTHAAELPSREAESFLVNSVSRMVYESDIKYDEMLSREILERAVLIHQVLLDETDSNEFGIVDMRIRLVTRAIEMARDKYADLDLQFFDKKEDVQYAEFGKEYMGYLLNLNKSVFDASAQYQLQKLAIKFYQYDLSRDVNFESYATDIVEIHDSLPSFPDSGISDRSALRYIRGLRSLVVTLGMNLSSDSSYLAPRRNNQNGFNPKVGYSSDEKIENSDNSVTIKWPKLSRGNEVYYLSWSKTSGSEFKMNTNVCKAFGFDSYLRDTSNIKKGSAGERVEVNSEGEFGRFLSNYYPIQEITCYQKATFKEVVVNYSNRKNNIDNSVTFEWPYVVYGGESYYLSWSSSDGSKEQMNKNVCNALGYDEFLEGTSIIKNGSAGKRAQIGNGGKFDRFLENYYPIQEITCFNN